MSPRIKLIVNLKLNLEWVCRNKWAMFRPASTGLGHALVVCDLTQILLRALVTHWLSVTWPRYFYGSWSRIGCLWPDPDTGCPLDTQCSWEYEGAEQITGVAQIFAKLEKPIYIKQQAPTMNRDQGIKDTRAPSQLQPDPSASIWVRSQTTNPWSRLVEVSGSGHRQPMRDQGL